jgi:hypothetical protein
MVDPKFVKHSVLKGRFIRVKPSNRLGRISGERE